VVRSSHRTDLFFSVPLCSAAARSSRHCGTALRSSWFLPGRISHSLAGSTQGQTLSSIAASKDSPLREPKQRTIAHRCSAQRERWRDVATLSSPPGPYQIGGWSILVGRKPVCCLFDRCSPSSTSVKAKRTASSMSTDLRAPAPEEREQPASPSCLSLARRCWSGDEGRPPAQRASALTANLTRPLAASWSSSPNARECSHSAD